MDQLPLVPSQSFLEAVQNAPVEWHHRWHHLVDAMQPESWRDFPAKMVATLPLDQGGHLPSDDQPGRDSATIIVDRLIAEIGQALERMQDRIKRPGTTGEAAASMAIDSTQLRMYLSFATAMEQALKTEEFDLMRAEDLNEGSREERQIWRKGFEERNAKALEMLQQYQNSVTDIIERLK